MKIFYFFMPLFLLSINVGAQLNIKNLIQIVDCDNYQCLADKTENTGYSFADSTYDADFNTSNYTFNINSGKALTENTIGLRCDGISKESTVHFETLTEVYFRQLIADINANGFILHQTLMGGSAIYNYPGTRLFIFVETDVYEDGTHYAFTLNYKPE